VTDLGGTNRDLGGVFADNNAALLDSMRSTVEAPPLSGSATLAASVGYGSSSTAAKAKPLQRFDPELLTKLHELNMKREMTNAINTNVTMEELGEVPVDPDPDSEPDSEPERKDKN
jgi:hypothetical protein